MRKLAGAMVVAGLAGALFGAWGVYTESGRANFDEMAGMIPAAALYFGIACAGAGATLLLLRRRRSS